MNKLLLLALAALVSLLSACGDRAEYAAHRVERSKPKMEVTDDRIALRRAPYPNLDIQPDGGLRVDDIAIPLTPEQQQILQTGFVKLQILRQNTLVDATPASKPGERTLPIVIPPGQEPFPADLAERIPEFKQYSEALANPRALR
jgi:hypothetical protein